MKGHEKNKNAQEYRDQLIAITISATLHLGPLLLLASENILGRPGNLANEKSRGSNGLSMNYIQNNNIVRHRIDFTEKALDASDHHETPNPNTKPDGNEVQKPNDYSSSEKAIRTIENQNLEPLDTLETFGQINDSENIKSGKSDANDASDLHAKYIIEIISLINLQWAQRDLINECKVRILQSPGGSVLSAHAIECELSVDNQRELEAAVLMAQPLPYIGFESVFKEDITISITPNLKIDRVTESIQSLHSNQ